VSSRTKKFLSYYRPYMGLFLLDMLCAVIVSAATLLFPLCASYITKNILPSDNPDRLNQLYLMGAVMLILVIVHTACNTFVDYAGHMMGTFMESDMRTDLFEHYQKLSFGFYDEQKTGQLMSRVTNDLADLAEFYHHGPEDLAIAILKLSGVLIILVNINLQLSLLILFFMPLIAVYAFYYNRKMNAAMLRSKISIGDINAQVEDTLAGIRVVKSFTNEELEKQKFAHKNRRFVVSRSDGYKSEAYFYGGMTFFTQLLTISVVVFGGLAIMGNVLTLPDLLTYLLCVAILLEPINRLVNFARVFQEGITGFSRFMDIMELTPEIQDSPDAIELPHALGEVEFRHVSFKYREDFNYVLKNLSLNIGAGEYVALVGYSGVGKTTLCSLIPRFYEVSQGQILLDGIDIRDISLQSLRSNIGIVQQDVYLFAGTVAENIGYGKPGAQRSEIIEAARQAHAHHFIMALPDGYDTDIGQRGVKLSGGQKQRLAIARVFLKNPAVLIFDEATSALDNESEKAIQESLEKLAENRTSIVIAHRLSTIRNAQRIVVMNETGIAEHGTHAELIVRNGIYAGLYNTQLTV
jgi:ATP-binding cassette, subfamily B, bacterial